MSKAKYIALEASVAWQGVCFRLFWTNRNAAHARPVLDLPPMRRILTAAGCLLSGGTRQTGRPAGPPSGSGSPSPRGRRPAAQLHSSYRQPSPPHTAFMAASPVCAAATQRHNSLLSMFFTPTHEVFRVSTPPPDPRS